MSVNGSSAYYASIGWDSELPSRRCRPRHASELTTILGRGSLVRYFVHSFVSIAAVVAIALHSVTGCCWHHDAPASSSNTRTIEPTNGGRCGCKRVENSRLREQRSQSRNQDDSCPRSRLAKCDYSVVSRVDHDAAEQVLCIGLPTALGASSFDVANSTPCFRLARATLDPPALRLHLRYCRLVI